MEATIDSVHPTTPNTQMAQLEYFLQAVKVSLNSSLYRRGGKMKAITPAPRAPAMSKKTVKSGIIKAIPVTQIITNERMRIFFSFRLEPTVKNGCYSAMSKAARICTGYEMKQLMQTQVKINVTYPLMGSKFKTKMLLHWSL